MIDGGLIRGLRIIVGLVRIDRGVVMRSGRGVSSRYSSLSFSLSVSNELVCIDACASCRMILGRVCVVCANACIGSNETSFFDSGGRKDGDRYGIRRGANLDMRGMCIVLL
jgi:hypothetical protein